MTKRFASSTGIPLPLFGRAVRLQTHDRDSRRLSAKNLGTRDQPPSGDSLWVKAFCLSDGDRTRAHCLSWRGDDIRANLQYGSIGGIDPLQSKLLLLNIAGLITIVALSASPRSFAVEQPTDVPAWLQTHVGEGEGQIAQVVLQRARALYLKKVSEGAVKNPCYFAMDATRPGGFGRRFYIICESNRTFRAVPSGHGSGSDLEGIANFANGIRCAKNFSDARDSKLTIGGPYVTAEIRTSFKGYYRASGGELVPLIRSFVQFDGKGDTANARPRAIGGHPGVIVWRFVG